jgi:hypothetical protein
MAIIATLSVQSVLLVTMLAQEELFGVPMIQMVVRMGFVCLTMWR